MSDSPEYDFTERTERKVTMQTIRICAEILYVYE